MAAWSKLDSRTRILLYAAIGVCISNRRKKLLKKKQIKRFWRRSIFRDRKLHSEYFTLFQTLRNSDREWFYRYVRMSPERFDHLLSLIRHKITKKDTRLRECISAEERLVITLRYLSQGMSQFTLCYSFRVGRQTVRRAQICRITNCFSRRFLQFRFWTIRFCLPKLDVRRQPRQERKFAQSFLCFCNRLPSRSGRTGRFFSSL